MMAKVKKRRLAHASKHSLEIDLPLSARARAEAKALQLDRRTREGIIRLPGIAPVQRRSRIVKKAISAPSVLNEAFNYKIPSSFSRGVRVELPDMMMLFLSGTASVDEKGKTTHAGDFPAQCLRTFRNLTGLLASEGASWHDVIRTTCYLKDIKRDYETFNKIRTMFMRTIGLDPLPASTGIEARLCRSDLLVEIEAIAMIPGNRRRKRGQGAADQER